LPTIVFRLALTALFLSCRIFLSLTKCLSCRPAVYLFSSLLNIRTIALFSSVIASIPSPPAPPQAVPSLFLDPLLLCLTPPPPRSGFELRPNQPKVLDPLNPSRGKTPSARFVFYLYSLYPTFGARVPSTFLRLLWLSELPPAYTLVPPGARWPGMPLFAIFSDVSPLPAGDLRGRTESLENGQFRSFFFLYF